MAGSDPDPRRRNRQTPCPSTGCCARNGEPTGEQRRAVPDPTGAAAETANVASPKPGAAGRSAQL
eukprot:3347882-Lingulodinium_polyedra.AAC.1